VVARMMVRFFILLSTNVRCMILLIWFANELRKIFPNWPGQFAD